MIVKKIVEKQMECRLAGKPKFSEKTCPSATFAHQKIHLTRPGFESGPPQPITGTRIIG
jgi:hypothetical protein